MGEGEGGGEMSEPPKVVALPIFDGETVESYVLDLCAKLKALTGQVADGDDSAWERMDPIAADLRATIETMRTKP